MNVAVTTTADRFDHWADTLRAHALDPVCLPCISVRTVPADVIDGARMAARGADRLVVTSARTIAAVWAGGPMPATPVLAVGQTTARAVRRAGGTVCAVGDGGALDLIREFGAELTGRTVAYPHAAGADPVILARLQTTAAAVADATVYATEPIPPALEPAVDAVIFSSPSAVDGWRTSRRLTGPALAAIGPTTASYLAGLDARPAVVASDPNPQALAQALAAHLTERNLI